MAIGALIITAIVLMKLKPVYQIILDGKVVGYIEDKSKFEEMVYQEFNDNEEENIAFADLKVDNNYEFKLIQNQMETNESEIVEKLKENADITYFQYALCANGKQKETFTSIEDANEVISNLKQQFNEEVNLSIARVYTKDLEVKNDVQIASICDNLKIEIKKDIQEEKRKEKATINGVYIAVVPVRGSITSRYGAREAIRDHTHKGLDIAAKTGTPIKAAASGKVTYSGTMGGYGNLIIIDHGNGVTTRYGHCNKLYKKVGAEVNAGDVIAAVGNTGNSTGSHLHFEIRKDGIYVNPSQYLF